MEVAQNIRDTNWVRYASDPETCWKTLNYSGACVVASESDTGHWISTDPYIITSDEGIWNLESSATNSGVYRDTNGLSVQTGAVDPNGWNAVRCSKRQNTECRSIFTRTVTFSHPADAAIGCTNTSCLQVDTRVDWSDSSKPSGHTIEFSAVLRNWTVDL